MGRIEDKIIEYANSGYYRFHMPGHKGNSPRREMLLDITEIDGFDNLHHAEGIIREAMDEAASYYGAGKTYYLVNGSTCGILAAMSAAANPGETVLVARNSHKSVFNSIYLKMLKSQYIYPQFVDKIGINGGILPEDVENLLNCQTNIKALLITSPTYEGVVSDVKAIAQIAHRHGVPLIVDEAHGAHLGRSSYFPISAIQCGADVVIQSLHKTMDSMTQTALLHINTNSLIDYRKIERYLSIYQTSSPSYILMASIDNCISNLISNGSELMEQYAGRLDRFYYRSQKLAHLKVADQTLIGTRGVYGFDKGKIVISCDETDRSGKWLYGKLRDKYHLQPEMACGNYVICMTSYMDSEEGLDRLAEALIDIDSTLKKVTNNNIYDNRNILPHTEVAETIYNAYNSSETEMLELGKVVGRISAEFAYLYPPGIPLIVPGEIISDNIVDIIDRYKDMGYEIQGLEDESAHYIICLK